MLESPGYYAIIPATVRYDKKLKANEKLLYGEITSLCNANGYCWATNAWFAELYDASPTTVSRWISNLEKCNYIKTQLVYKNGTKLVEQRQIFLLPVPLDEKINTPLTKKSIPLDEKRKENIKNTTTTISFKDESQIEPVDNIDLKPETLESSCESTDLITSTTEKCPDPEMNNAVSEIREIEKEYMRLTKRPSLTQRDLKLMCNLWMRGMEKEFIISCMEKAVENYVNNYGELNIKAFKYFIPFIEEEWSKEMMLIQTSASNRADKPEGKPADAPKKNKPKPGYKAGAKSGAPNKFHNFKQRELNFTNKELKAMLAKKHGME